MGLKKGDPITIKGRVYPKCEIFSNIFCLLINIYFLASPMYIVVNNDDCFFKKSGAPLPLIQILQSNRAAKRKSVEGNEASASKLPRHK